MKVNKTSEHDSSSEASDDDIDSDEHYVYVINKEKQLQPEDTVTLQIAENDIFLRFQIDTGADVNVLPVHKYIAATGDIEMRNVRPSPLRHLTSFTGDKTTVVGCVHLPISRYDKKSRILCQLVEGCQFRTAILGKTDSVALGVVKRIDTDAQRMPAPTNASVFAITAIQLTREKLFHDFADVFANKVGKLDGQYKITLDTTVAPVQHAPLRVPAPLRDQLKKTLADIVKDGIIAPISESTPWISSLNCYCTKEIWQVAHMS